MDIPLDDFPEIREHLVSELGARLKEHFIFLDEERNHFLKQSLKESKKGNKDQVKILSELSQDYKMAVDDCMAIVLALLDSGASDIYMNDDKILAIIAERRARSAAERASELSPNGQALRIQSVQRGRPGIVLRTAISRMEEDIANGRLSLPELRSLLGKEIEARYGLSHAVAVEARKKVLDRLYTFQPKNREYHKQVGASQNPTSAASSGVPPQLDRS